jgi:prepilin-type N-terminal cleavage/methylation domain-containing protein
MKKILGFTLIEFMIVLAIVGIILAVAIPAFQGKGKQHVVGQQSIQTGGYVQQQSSGGCSEGYKVLPNGSQLLNEHGGGIPCNR